MPAKNEQNSSRAYEHRREGEYSLAGDYFTQSAYEALRNDAIRLGDDGQIGHGLYYLLHATVCYRLAKEDKRAQNRAQQGILIAEDLKENVVKESPKRGMLGEFIGDFNVTADLEDATEMYRLAASLYGEGDVEYTSTWDSNPLIERNLKFFEDVVESANYEVEDFVEWRFAFTTRVNYKSKKFHDILAMIFEEGHWD